MGLHKEYKGQPGQTLAEYVLAGGLVALVAVGALIFLSGTLESALPDLLNRIFGDGPTVAATIPGTPQSGPAPLTPSAIPSGLAPAGNGTVQITLSGGQTLTLPNYPNSTAQTVETSGVNGATKIMLAQMQSVIEQLETAGTATPQQLQTLRELANAGHEIAKIERLLEDAAVASGGDMTAYRNMTMTYNGKTYTVTEWGNQIGYRGENTKFAGNPFDRSTMDYANGPLGEFVLRYEEALKSGAMADPAVKTVVGHLANEILLIAGMAEYQVDNMAAPDDLVSGSASKLTHLDSGGICRTGGDEDTGIYCP